MNVEEWLVKMVPTLCPSLMVAGLWSLYLPLATSSVALNRANSICQYDVTYFDSPVYVWALRLLCLPKLMDVRFWLTCAAPQFSPETNHLKYWARLACLQLLACEFWLSTYLFSSPNDGWREMEPMMSFWWISLKTNSVGRPWLHLQRSRVKGSSAFSGPACLQRLNTLNALPFVVWECLI